MEPTAVVSQAQLLAEVFEETRKLTRFYLSKIDPDWAEWRPVADGVPLNSAYWLVAHLAWAENALILQSLGGQGVDIPWLKHYALGCDGKLHDNRPSFSELLQELDRVHQQAMQQARALTDEQLDEPASDSEIQWRGSKRKVFYHAIRHEGTHVGHFGWLCKIKGVETI